MARPAYILFGLAAAGCASTTGEDDPRTPLLHDTTIMRHDGTAITLEELGSIRFSAIATADTVARIERELREPWAEDRTPGVLIENLTLRHPAETRLARTLWESAEPVGYGHDRARFREYGFYSNQMTPTLYAPRVRPATLEAFVEELLKTHDDSTPTLMLLAAWRRFAPMMSVRPQNYLASSWLIELDYFRPVTVSLADSLLGPHLRCGVIDAENLTFPGPTDSVDGYTTSVMLLDLLMPGPQSPVSAAMLALSRVAQGESIPLPFTVAGGETRTADDLDMQFLQAALRGLAGGACDPAALPASTTRFSVTYSYLVDLGEARSTLTFRRIAGGWELELFEYEPAAASLIGGSAKLDLLPVVRDLAQRNQRG
jgi:hypothetical protein